MGRRMPRLISHRKLHGRRYIMDDTLFLQVEVDHNDHWSLCCATVEPSGKQAQSSKLRMQDFPDLIGTA